MINANSFRFFQKHSHFFPGRNPLLHEVISPDNGRLSLDAPDRFLQTLKSLFVDVNKMLPFFWRQMGRGNLDAERRVDICVELRPFDLFKVISHLKHGFSALNNKGVLSKPIDKIYSEASIGKGYFEQLGIKKVIATPHSMADGYVNSNEKIIKLRDELREAAKANGINIELDAAAEYYADEAFMDKIARKDLLTMGKRYVLMELSYVSKPQNVGEIVYKLQVAGYDLILAHPERYPYYHEEDFSSYESLKDRKVFFQINIPSLVGRYGAGAEYTAKRMIDEGMVEFVGSDLHTLNSFEVLRTCLKDKYLEKILTSDKLLNKTLL